MYAGLSVKIKGSNISKPAKLNASYSKTLVNGLKKYIPIFPNPSYIYWYASVICAIIYIIMNNITLSININLYSKNPTNKILNNKWKKAAVKKSCLYR